MSRKKVRINDRKDVLFRQSRKFNDHCQDFLLVRDFGLGLRPRQFLTKHIWKRINGGKFVHAIENVEESELFPEPAIPNPTVATKSKGCIFYEPVFDVHFANTNHQVTKVKYIAQFTLGGIIPHQLVDMTAVGHLSEYSLTRKLFCKGERSLNRELAVNYKNN